MTEEYTGGSVSYYRVRIDNPTSDDVDPYQAECNDIIEALGMNYAEGNAFKALWRRAAARNLGMAKKGYEDGLYDAEKVVFFGERLVVQEAALKAEALSVMDEAQPVVNNPSRLRIYEKDAMPEDFGQQNVIEWPESDERIDAIAQNGNDGEHYDQWPDRATHKLTTAPAIGKTAYAFLSDGEYYDESGDSYFVMRPKGWIVIEARPE